MKSFSTLISIFNFGFLSLILIFILAFLCNEMIVYSAKGEIYDTTETIPYNKVGLVLGTSKYANTSKGVVENPYFKYRIEAATSLYKSGKVKYLLLSGDNREVNYNEPIKMKESLIKRGVNPKHIIMDFAGRRTLDSIIRAKQIYDLEEFTIISQKFHNERALFLSQQMGLKTIAYNAEDVEQNMMKLKNQIRESLARVKAVLDIIFRVDAQILGNKEFIPV